MTFFALLSIAFAVPSTVSHQGRLLNAAGEPVDGPQDIVFELYPAAQGGTSDWSETHSLDLQRGYYAVELGTIDPIDLDELGDELWLQITAGTDGPLRRQRLLSSPFALRAASVAPDALQGMGPIDGSTASFSSWVRTGETAEACVDGLAGAIRFNGTAFEGCDGEDWLVLGTAGELSAGTPTSCAAILAASRGTADSGSYVIDPGTGPITVTCDMETDGGGWTQVLDADYKTDACPGTLAKHSATWGCYRNIGTPGIRKATIDTLGVSWSELRGVITGSALGSMEAFHSTAGTVDMDSRYVDGMGLFTASGDHVFTFAMASWPECPTCSCPNDTEGGPAPSGVGTHYECGSWPAWHGYRFYPMFRDQEFARTMDAATTDSIVLSMQTDQPTSNEDFSLRKLALWIR